MSANEYLIDASTRHQIMLQRLSGGSFNKLKPLLEKLQKDIRARLSENPTDFQMHRLTALMRDIQALFDAANSEVSKQLNLDLEEFIPYETDFQYRMLGNAVTTELTLPAIEQVVASVTTAKAELISGKVIKKLTISGMVKTLGEKPKTIENKIRAGIIEGKSVDQMVRDIMRIVDKAHKQDVRTIVRTAFNLAGSEARRAVNAANSDVLIGERLVVTLDSRTSATCYGLGSKNEIYKIGEGPQPPLHFGCRTIRTGVVDPRYAVPGIKGLKSAHGDVRDERLLGQLAAQMQALKDWTLRLRA
jgi:nucleotide-binding universal stress UspA family protein